MEKKHYEIVYIMPKGSRVGIFRKLSEKEAEDLVKRLRNSGCRIEKVESRDT